MTGTKLRITLVIIAVTIFLVHSGLQFFAWAAQPGNAVGRGIAAPWTIVSFPLFWVVPRQWANRWFELLLVANSLIWAASVTWLISLAIARRVDC